MGLGKCMAVKGLGKCMDVKGCDCVKLVYELIMKIFASLCGLQYSTYFLL